MPRRKNSSNSSSLTIAMAAIIALLPLELLRIGEANPYSNWLKCKYSVRDVGFVNVHSFGWQLMLAKPLRIQATDFDSLEQRVRMALERTNVSHVWIARDSNEWKELHRKLDFNAKGELIGILTNSNGESFGLPGQITSNENDLEERYSVIESLVDSPFRRKVMAACSESLCSIVLVESNNPKLNQQARSLLTESVGRIGKQMWELEKPTEKPPTGLVLELNEQPIEYWFLNSLGFSRNDDKKKDQAVLNEPTFAILYGQGRRLGELIPLSVATIDKLVGRAAICGGDCECELDRDWLYGHQVIHRWPRELENKTDLTLNFDPHAALVKSEVAAIVRKTSRNGSKKPLVDLGPGLIIHDLEPIERKTKQGESETKEQTKSEEGKNNNLIGQDDDQDKTDQKKNNATESQAKSNAAQQKQPANQPGFRFPLSLIVTLVVLVILTLVWSLSKGGS